MLQGKNSLEKIAEGLNSKYRLNLQVDSVVERGRRLFRVREGTLGRLGDVIGWAHGPAAIAALNAYGRGLGDGYSACMTASGSIEPQFVEGRYTPAVEAPYHVSAGALIRVAVSALFAVKDRSVEFDKPEKFIPQTTAFQVLEERLGPKAANTLADFAWRLG